MGSEYLQVFIRMAEQTQHWRIRTKNPECYAIEDLIPCPMWSESKMYYALVQGLLETGYEIEEDDYSDTTPWAYTSLMFDFDKRRLILSGLSNIWNLHQTTLARFAFPLLKSAGWKNWDIYYSVDKFMGPPLFDKMPQIEYQKCEQKNITDFHERFATQSPWDEFEHHQNLLISLRQNHQLKHYLVPDGGSWFSQICLNQGTSLIDILAEVPECGLLSETEVYSSLLIDCDCRLLVQSVEELDAVIHLTPCDPHDLKLIWPGWQFELNLQGYVGHLRNLGLLSESVYLLLNAEKLSDYIRGFYLADPANDFYMYGTQSVAMSKEKLCLRDWIDGLYYPHTKSRIIKHLDQIVSSIEIPVWVHY